MATELILIIEDHEQNLKPVRDLLQVKGYRTLEAETAELGIELARSHTPHLILMDIQLPGMDGVTALGQLKANPKTAYIPVIGLTAFAMPDDRQAPPLGRLRWLPGEADQHTRAAGGGRAVL